MPIWDGLSGPVMWESVMGAREEVMELTHWVPCTKSELSA